jgi:hypothetical protein
MSKSFLWIRCGDRDHYHRFDTLGDVFKYLTDCGVIFPVKRANVHGMVDKGDYTVFNYISFYKGDSNGSIEPFNISNHIKLLNAMSEEGSDR